MKRTVTIKKSLSAARGFLIKHRKPLGKLAAALLAILAWQAVAMIINERLILVSPWGVVKALPALFSSPKAWEAVWFSISRTTAGFLLALVGGVLLAIPAVKYPIVETLLSPYMTVIKSVPVAAIIVLIFVWFNPSTLSAFIAFLIVLPTVYNNLLTGLRSVDPKMIEMANLFGLSFPRRLLSIYLPHIRPYAISACSLAAGLAWKSGVAAEIIAFPGGSIGNMIYSANTVLATEQLFAWTVVIVLLSVGFEKLVVALVRLAFRALARL